VLTSSIVWFIMEDMSTQTIDVKIRKAIAGKCWREKHKAEIAAKKKAAYLANPEAQRIRERRYYHKVRELILDNYGRACIICGSTEGLALDHINNDGRIHRLSLGDTFRDHRANLKSYVDLIRRGFPQEGFRMLCISCNIKEYWKWKRSQIPDGGN
jgi:hypothetical protein